MIEGVIHHCTEMEVDRQYVDSHGQSTIAFAFCRLLGFLLLPTNLLIAIGLVGAILMATRLASLGRKLVVAAVLLLILCGLSPLGKIQSCSRMRGPSGPKPP